MEMGEVLTDLRSTTLQDLCELQTKKSQLMEPMYDIWTAHCARLPERKENDDMSVKVKLPPPLRT